MKPIVLILESDVQVAALDFCEQLLDLKKWPHVKGNGVLPGMQKAEFRKRTKNIVGTQVLVTNTDGSTYVETVEAWEPAARIELRTDAFSNVLRYLARYFIDTYECTAIEGGTHVKRTIQLVPVNIGGKLFLWYMARQLRKSLAIQAKIQF